MSASVAADGIGVVTMPNVTAIVFVVDDDIPVRESLELLIMHAGWQPTPLHQLLIWPRGPRGSGRALRSA